MTNRYYRMSALATTPVNKGLLPVSPATIWRWVREGHFPKPVKLGPMLTVWRSEDVESFLAGATDSGLYASAKANQ